MVAVANERTPVSAASVMESASLSAISWEVSDYPAGADLLIAVTYRPDGYALATVELEVSEDADRNWYINVADRSPLSETDEQELLADVGRWSRSETRGCGRRSGPRFHEIKLAPLTKPCDHLVELLSVNGRNLDGAIRVCAFCGTEVA